MRCALITGVQTGALPISGRVPARHPHLHRLEAAVVGIARRRTGNGGVLRPRAALAGGKPGAAARVAWRLRARCAGVHGESSRLPPLLQGPGGGRTDDGARSEEHTSELQSLMRISYAVFCLKK